MGGSKRCVQAARPDLGTWCAPNLKFPTISFNSAHTLYNKIDHMTADPQWRNGYMDFQLAKNREFWYRDVLECIKDLLRR